MDLMPLAIQLLTGAVGGNVTGKIAPKLNLGTLGNSIAGILGGGLGGQLLGALGINADPSGSLDVASILGSIASGGVGGAVVMLIVGLIKSALSRK